MALADPDRFVLTAQFAFDSGFVPPRKKVRTARKSPQQARSIATVEAILDGAIQVLDRDDVVLATTTAVAEAAGVSVGTLYQYFADRDSIIDALQDREFERAQTMLAGLLADASTLGERQLARAIVAGLLELYRAAPGLHRLLVVDGLRVSPTGRVVEFDRQIVETLRVFFETTALRVTRKDGHAAAFVVYQSVRATLLAAVFEEPVGLSDQRLVDELTDFVVGHLSERSR